MTPSVNLRSCGVTLAWLFHTLAAHPTVEAQLHAELDHVLGKRMPTAADLPTLPYLKQVIEETLRRYPAAYLSTRQSIAADEICGYAIPAKSIVLINIYGLHHHPDYWADPVRFDPDRFAPTGAQANNHDAYLPFLLGPRKCIGEPLAHLEMALITETVAQRFRLRADPTRPAKLTTKFTLRAQGGLWMIPEARSAHPEQSAAQHLAHA
ncbi:MAG: cytochrome P450 [Caldilineaceae bacterium]